MTRIKLNIFLLVSMLAAFIYGVVIHAQSSQTGNVNKPSRIVPEGPVIDYAGPDTPDSSNDFNLTGTERDRRHAKSASYDRPKSLPIKEEPGTWPVDLSDHWWVKLPALPVDRSDAIAVGVITGSRAFLSNDKHAVYSEFYLQVEQILKDGTHSVSLGPITTTRFGGIVRFPSGRKYVYQISKQGWPAAGSRYVLFLRKNQSGDFDIVTGYELRDGVAEPLDGTQGSTVASQLQKYAGTPEPDFLEAIKTALMNSTAGGHNL